MYTHSGMKWAMDGFSNFLSHHKLFRLTTNSGINFAIDF